MHTHSCSLVSMAENSLVVTLVRLKKHFDVFVFLAKNITLYNFMNIKLSKISRFDAEIYFNKPWEPNSCLFHLNTYVMGLRSLYIFNYLSAGTDFRRHNLTSSDVKF